MLRIATDRVVPLTVQRPEAPGRWTHAYLEDSETTVCGTALHHLHWRQFVDQPWQHVSPLIRCLKCAAALDGA